MNAEREMSQLTSREMLGLQRQSCQDDYCRQFKVEQIVKFIKQ